MSQIETVDCFSIVFTGSFNGVFSCAILDCMLKVNKTCHVQKHRIAPRMFPTKNVSIKYGTSNLGSLTPLVSDDGDEVVTRALSSFFYIE